ncbi:hypothetical protein GGTG_01055 [Gaeumannomyces tritici R3-111a-1]|uniref:Uncharacterized protein n=1 Tax=Gaeumannomyces tritici (strain R3-111a-1) TaxID=644352 RepID=J3NIH5_GAET3|nr:hypothetical protein GGTG_01055 [Gaeumannomyces tritici R3-111a-1]EJT81068.1 hypothetical protein GGTG_01055 [Gaeumannomyces tritici R3-111a-1]
MLRARSTSAAAGGLSVIQQHDVGNLSQTGWLNKPFSSQGIKLLLAPARPASTTTPAAAASRQSTHADVVGPYIDKPPALGNDGQTAAGIKGEGKATLLTEQQGHEEAERSSPKAVLLEFATLLLEIWHHRPLEMWLAKVGMAGVDASRLESRHMAAIRWLEMTSE